LEGTAAFTFYLEDGSTYSSTMVHVNQTTYITLWRILISISNTMRNHENLVKNTVP
jgi:hypothetical protein